MEAHTDTACLALMDTVEAGDVWEDLLYDGHDHDHGAGGLMLNGAAIGTHFDHDGTFPVRLHRNAAGVVVALEVNLDPYGDDLDSLRRPAGWTEEGEHDHAHEHGLDHDHGHGHSHDDLDHGHGHEPLADGWSSPVVIRMKSATALFGDPVGLPEADDTGGLLDIVWPAAGGQVQASVYAHGGIRRRLTVVWTA